MGRSLLALALFAVITASAATVGAHFRPGPWYEALAKPSWTPPNWVFAPVWTTLYVLITAAGWLAWREDGSNRAVTWWLAASAFNAAWPWLFFGLHHTELGLVDLALLIVSIIAFIRAAAPLSRWAALLFVPYLLWVAYASTLNAGVWAMN